MLGEWGFMQMADKCQRSLIYQASYIKKMSNYCEDCKYDPTIKTGDKACPFNSLYWHFIDTHKDNLKSNPRMSMMLNLHHKMDKVLKTSYKEQAKKHIESI